MPFDALLARIRGEYREMPGLRLTVAQGCRLCQLDAPTCTAVMEELVVQGFRMRTRDGAFVALPAAPRSLQDPRQLRLVDITHALLNPQVACSSGST